MSTPLITLMTGPYSGGIGRTVTNLSNTFHSLGYRAEILLDGDEFPYAGQVCQEVKIRSLKTRDRIGGIPHLASYCRQHKPAVILTPFVQLTALAVRTRLFLKSAPRIFVVVHNTYSTYFMGYDEKRRNRRIKHMKQYYPKCDGIIAVSDGVARDFSSFTAIPESSITTIYNPVVTDELIRKSKEQPEHPWFQPGQPPVLLTLGRLVESKNLDVTIDAFTHIRKELNCRLVILGDGPHRNTLESQAKQTPCPDDILFMGHQDNVFGFIKNASAVVLASRFEGLPTILIESMALGTPLVSTDCPHGPSEILENGRLGALVPIGDPTALARAILFTLNNPLDPEVLISSAERFRDTVVARDYLDLFGL
jgi:glycosyltransferase involved in cell wall biosynthesis